MAAYNEKKSSDYTRLDAMTTEELENMLRQDAQIPDSNDVDVDTLMQIAELIRSRRTPDPDRKKPEEALELFKQHYLGTDTPEEKPQPVPEKKPGDSGTVIYLSPWMRRLLSAAAVAVILFVSGSVADAMGYDLWEKFLRWSQDTFYFARESESTTPPPSKEDNTEYESLQQVLDYRDITLPLVPKWMPERFSMDKIKVYENPVMGKYLGIYLSGEEILKIQINRSMEDAPIHYERENDAIEEYESGGIVYYLAEERDSVLAVWIIEEFECSISGNVTMDELKRMLDSIGE